MTMRREDNISIFKDTENLVKSNKKILNAVQFSTDNQQLILEESEFRALELKRYMETAKVVVSSKRTLEAASLYAHKGMKTAVHNFASATNPGGGVTRGSSAQEECLCRCSGLYFSLNTKPMWDGFYNPHRNTHNPVHNDDIIYTPGVVVFKTDTASPKLMDEKYWYNVDVITCAAPNLREKPGNIHNLGDGDKCVKVSDKQLLEIQQKRLRRILDIAVDKREEAVILGAFGCGAFMNKPEVVALAAKNVIKDYLNAFKAIEFAVYCSPRDDRNYKTFARVLKSVAQ